MTGPGTRDLAIGVLVMSQPGEPPPPEHWPLGRAALMLAGEGIELVFGERVIQQGRLSGFIARPGRWEPVRHAVIACAYDRFPYRLAPRRYDALITGLGEVPVANAPRLMRLFQDKLATQRFATGLGVPMPEVEPRPDRFADRLAAWGAAFAKPRFGTAGRGIARVLPGDPVPEHASGTTADADGPMFLQRAIEPPPSYRGVCVRVTVQRSVDGGWHYNPAVARHSESDSIVNAARGAAVAPAEQILPPRTLAAIGDLCDVVCRGLSAQPDGAWMIEMGLDFVIDRSFEPWLLEINARPLGRLAALAGHDPAAFEATHRAALTRPLRYLRHISFDSRRVRC